MARVYEGPDTARVEDQQAKKCTFTPHVNERSRLIIDRSRDLPSGFLERQVRLRAGGNSFSQCSGRCMTSC